MHRFSRILPPALADTDTNQPRRSFWLGVLNGTFYIMAEAIMEPNLVLATFISSLSSSPFWIGLIMPLRDGGWFLPQLWVSTFTQNKPYKMEVYRHMVVVRLFAWLAMVLSVFLIRDRTLLLFAFFLAFGTGAMASGVSGLAFLEIVGKTVPSRRRGEYFAWRLATGGLAGLVGSLVVRWLLDENSGFTYPVNFGLLFSIALVMAAIGLYAFALIHEPPSENLLPRATFGEQLKRALQLVRHDHNYRRFIYLRSALIIGGAATPFFAVYVQHTLDGLVSMIAVYLAVQTASNLFSNLAFTRLSARLGNRRTMGVAALAGLAMALIVAALLLAASLWQVSGWIASLWLIPVFALSALREAAAGVASQSLLLDIAPSNDRTIYLGFTSTLTGIILLSTGFSGVVVQILGFPFLLFIVIFAHIVALISVKRLSELRN